MVENVEKGGAGLVEPEAESADNQEVPQAEPAESKSMDGTADTAESIEKKKPDLRPWKNVTKPSSNTLWEGIHKEILEGFFTDKESANKSKPKQAEYVDEARVALRALKGRAQERGREQANTFLGTLMQRETKPVKGRAKEILQGLDDGSQTFYSILQTDNPTDWRANRLIAGMFLEAGYDEHGQQKPDGELTHKERKQVELGQFIGNESERLMIELKLRKGELDQARALKAFDRFQKLADYIGWPSQMRERFAGTARTLNERFTIVKSPTAKQRQPGEPPPMPWERKPPPIPERPGGSPPLNPARKFRTVEQMKKERSRFFPRGEDAWLTPAEDAAVRDQLGRLPAVPPKQVEKFLYSLPQQDMIARGELRPTDNLFKNLWRGLKRSFAYADTFGWGKGVWARPFRMRALQQEYNNLRRNVSHAFSEASKKAENHDSREKMVYLSRLFLPPSEFKKETFQLRPEDFEPEGGSVLDDESGEGADQSETDTTVGMLDDTAIQKKEETSYDGKLDTLMTSVGQYGEKAEWHTGEESLVAENKSEQEKLFQPAINTLSRLKKERRDLWANYALATYKYEHAGDDEKVLKLAAEQQQSALDAMLTAGYEIKGLVLRNAYKKEEDAIRRWLADKKKRNA